MGSEKIQVKLPGAKYDSLMFILGTYRPCCQQIESELFLGIQGLF